jgi:hypothetical protein
MAHVVHSINVTINGGCLSQESRATTWHLEL